jgi:hypothetical protein
MLMNGMNLNCQLFSMGSSNPGFLQMHNTLQDRSLLAGLLPAPTEISLSVDQQEMMKTQAKQIEGAIRLLQMQHDSIMRVLRTVHLSANDGTKICANDKRSPNGQSTTDPKLQTQTSFKTQFALPSQPLPASELSTNMQIKPAAIGINAADQSTLQLLRGVLSSNTPHFLPSSLAFNHASDASAHQSTGQQSATSAHASFFSHPSSSGAPSPSSQPPSSRPTAHIADDDIERGSPSASSERKRPADDDADAAKPAKKGHGTPVPNAGKLVLDAEVRAEFTTPPPPPFDRILIAFITACNLDNFLQACKICTRLRFISFPPRLVS